MKTSLLVACCLLALGVSASVGCSGKDPKKNPDFNAGALENPGAIKMGGDARPEKSGTP